MLKQIKKLSGITNERDFVEAYKTLHFYLDRGQATNGSILLDVPIGREWKFDVPSKEFMAVINAVGPDAELSIKENSVFVFKDDFKAKVPRIKDPFPMKQVDGEEYKLPSGFVESLRLLRPFMSVETYRPFTSTINIKGEKATASNASSAARKILPGVPDLILPIYGVDFLLNYEYEPESIFLSDEMAYFTFEDDSWAGVQLTHASWPDITPFDTYRFKDLEELPPGFHEKLESLMPIFKIAGDRRLYMTPDKINTAEGDYYAEQKSKGLYSGLYSIDVFYLCVMNATHADFDKYPEAVPLTDRKSGLDIIMMGMAEEG